MNKTIIGILLLFASGVSFSCNGVIIGSSNDRATPSTGKGLEWHLNTIDMECTWYNLSEKQATVYDMKEQLEKVNPELQIDGIGIHRIDYLVVGLDGWVIVDGTGPESGANAATFVYEKIWKMLPSSTHLITVQYPDIRLLRDDWVPNISHAIKQTHRYNYITKNAADHRNNWSVVTYANSYPRIDGIHPTQVGKRHLAIEILHAIFQREDR